MLATLDADLLARYRKHRNNFTTPAKYAWQWAKAGDPREASGLTWTYSNSTGFPLGHGEIDGFEIRVRFDYDGYQSPDGVFTDTPSERAIRNPRWDRATRNERYRYYIPEVSVQEHVDGLRALGYARHDAWLTARGYVLADLTIDAEGDFAVCTVTVLRDGIELAEESVGHIHGTEDDDLIFVAVDIVQDALSTAREALAKLSPPAPVQYAVTATVSRTSDTGWTSTRQVPTFLLDSRVQGITSAEHAARIALDVVNAFGDPIEVSVTALDTAVAQTREVSATGSTNTTDTTTENGDPA